MSTITIQSAINIDFKYDFTPDRIPLRYKGPICVFLWDELKDYSTFKEHIIGDVGSQYNSCYHQAITKQEFFLGDNQNPDPRANNHYLIPKESLDVLPKGVYTTRQVKGKIIKVSLDLLEELDLLFENRRNSVRREIDVYPTEWSTTNPPLKCHTWIHSCDYITNTVAGVSKLKSSIDLIPSEVTPRCSLKDKGLKDYYEV